MATLNLLGQFDPENERIEDYKERYDFYCVAHRPTNVCKIENMNTAEYVFWFNYGADCDSH